MPNQSRISIRLHGVIEKVGVTETTRRLHQKSAALQEIFLAIKNLCLNGKTLCCHICGSRYEGSVTPDLESDVDVVFFDPSTPQLVLDPSQSRDHLALLMVRDVGTPPGYMKLQLVFNGKPVTSHDIGDIKLPSETYTRYDTEQRVCIEHITSDDMHGPARMSIDTHGVHITDSVYAYKCNNIPEHAKQWIHRQRHHGWPTKQQVEIMSRMGCMVVGVGHWESQEQKIEWRMSFSLQERLLMTKLNPVQHKTYVLLKMIKKDILEQLLGRESLTSYHFKTCVLYAAETTPAKMWIPEKLVNCVIYCLKLLIRWIDDNFCPSYFIQEQNIFARQGFGETRLSVRAILQILIETKLRFLYLLDSDNISSIIRSKYGLKRIKQQMSAKKLEYMHKLKLTFMFYTFDSVMGILNNLQDPAIVLHELHLNDIPDHTNSAITVAINSIKSWLHLHLAKCLAARVIQSADAIGNKTLMAKISEHFRCAEGIDVSNVRFTQVSMLYKIGHYKKCLTLLEEIEQDLTYTVLSYCPCRKMFVSYVRNKQQKSVLYQKLGYVPLTRLMRCHLASCVVFMRPEVHLAPVALQYEMHRSLDTESGTRNEVKDFWFDWAVVDARVYLYYMQYMVYSALSMGERKLLAIANLRSEILCCTFNTRIFGENRLGHKDTAYNLLGWIYLQENRKIDALQCFEESWKIRPHHNAAKFHFRNVFKSRKGSKY